MTTRSEVLTAAAEADSSRTRASGHGFSDEDYEGVSLALLYVGDAIREAALRVAYASEEERQ